MLNKTEGIIIQTIKYGDSGRILHIYTYDNGLMSFIAQGLNSKNNLNKTHFQHLNIIEFDYYNNNRSRLRRVKDSKILHDNSQLRVEKIYLLIFIAELIKNSIKEEEANHRLYLFLKTHILNLQMEQKSNILFLLHFCLRLSNYLGFYPLDNDSKYFNLIEGCFENSLRNASYTLSAENSLLLKELLKGREDFSMHEKKELLNSFIRFYSYHIQNFKEPKSLQIIETIGVY